VLTIDKEAICLERETAVKLAQHNKHERRVGKTEDFVGQDVWRSSKYDAQFKKANCISKDDYVLIPSKFNLQDGKSTKSDFYYLVGAFLGDGYLKKDKNGKFEAISFCIGKDEIELCAKIHSLIKKFSSCEPHDFVCEERNGIYISVYDRKLAQWFSDYIGSGSKNKRIKLPIKFKEDAKQLLAGYLDTDGCMVNKTNQNVRGNNFGGFQISSVNIGLLEDTQQLLISMGCISRISTFARVASESSVVNVDTIENTLAIGSNASNVFSNSIKYINSPFDSAEIKAGKSFVTYIDESPYMACPVKSVEIKEFNEPVYDLTVEGDESYIADGIAIHNCSVEYSICNICGNKAEKTEDYCFHIRERKGRTFSGKARNVKTGETKEFSKEPVFEYNYGIKFIELSAVVDPACQSCLIQGLISNDEYMAKVANMENTIRMIRTSAIEKKAGQQELDQLNTCLKTLEDISVQLIQNRQQIEVDFASDLVGILSELQTFVDELVGAGYGNVQSVPGVADAPMGEVPLEGGGLPVEGAPLEAAPIAAETPLAGGGVGTVSGAPTNPLVSTPQLPITAPAKPLAFNSSQFKRIASTLEVLKDRMCQDIGDDDMGKRRTLVQRVEQQKVATEVLSNSWQEKQAFFEYINRVPSVQDNDNKLSVSKRGDSFIIVAENKELPEQKIWTFEDLTDDDKKLIESSPKEAALYFLETFANSLNNKVTREGEDIMTDNIKEAGAQSVNKQPEVVTEAQLDKQRDLYHARTGEEQNVITEKQLGSDTGSHPRTGEEEVITEAQLAEKSNKLNPRKDENAEVITEAQLNDDKSGVSPRKEDAPNVVTEKQLPEGGYVNPAWEKDVVTEKQLDSIEAPWARAASRDASLFISAGDHLKAVIDVLSNTSIATGCTPKEACEVAGSLVDSTKDRFELGNAILDKTEEEAVDYSTRLAYWNKKNIKVAGVGSKEIAEAIVRGLRVLASDSTINPEVIIDAIDVLSDGEEGSVGISKRIDEKLEEAKQETVKASKKDELKQALRESVHGKDEREEERKEISASLDKEDDKLTREAEREVLEKALDDKEIKPDTMIETTFEELGVKDKSDDGLRPAIKGFASAACASSNMKLAAITNVTINGETISIAVQTDAGEESVEIPIGEGVGPIDEEVVPEGDLTGEGLEDTLGTEVGAPLPALASNKSKMTRKAQSPMGGGVPGTAGEVAGGAGAPESGLPGNAPMADPVQSLTTEEEGVTDEIPTAGEKQMPFAICPECGSSDVDIEKEAQGNIKGDCKACGAEYEALIKKAIEFTIIKPTRSIGEDGAVGEPEAPEVPALPVAAQTKLSKDVLIRVASNQDKFGHVCPACGMSQCKVAAEGAGHTEYQCPACGTEVNKDVVVNTKDPDESYLRVQWDLVPDTEGCEGCEEEAEKFASIMKVEKMMKAASSDTAKFPMANCMERVARKWGGNSVATSGPCKGKPLAECVCGRLERLGLTKVRHMERLGSASMQEDPMDQCLEDQKKKGFEVKEAENICNCLKKKFASEEDDNIFLQAFADDIASGKEKVLTARDLSTIKDLMVEAQVADIFEDTDMGDELAPVDGEGLADVVEETVTIEVSKETAEELADAATVAATDAEVDVDVVEGVPEMGAAADLEVAAETEVETEISENKEEEKELAMSMQSHKLRRVGEEVVKIAATPTKVEDIEGDVEAGVPRAKATMGAEGADNIDVPMAKPSVPRAKATMGKEGPDNIDKPAGLPDVAVDSSYMGDEKAVQSGMPAINNEIKGTVIAEVEVEGNVIKEAKQLKEVETVEGDVEAGVPRSKATIGGEGADNIDVPMAKPSVPRAKAEMGNEGADNINPKAVGPDVPVDSAYMGDEKAVQKNMPAINDEILKNVQQSKERQQERIASARRMKAVEVTAKLLATSRITEGAYDNVIDALSQFEIDKISAVAENMYPVKKVAAKPAPEGHSIPAVLMESKEITSPSDDLQTKLASTFTIGNKAFDEKLTIYGEK